MNKCVDGCPRGRTQSQGLLPLWASLDRATTEEEVGLVPLASRWRQRLPVSARGHLPCPCWSHVNPRAEPELGPELRSGGPLGLWGAGAACCARRPWTGILLGQRCPPSWLPWATGNYLGPHRKCTNYS